MRRTVHGSILFGEKGHSLAFFPLTSDFAVTASLHWRNRWSVSLWRKWVGFRVRKGKGGKVDVWYAGVVSVHRNWKEFMWNRGGER